MGFNLVTSDGQLRKSYSLNGELELDDRETYYGTEFWTLKSYSDKELTLQIIHDTLLTDEGEHFCILPNVTWGKFRRTKDFLGDEPRTWCQLDIDWCGHGNHPAFPNPRTTHTSILANHVIKRLDLPLDLGYVAQRSSSAKIKPDELRIRIYLLLDEALNSDQLKTAFNAYDVDLGMMEYNRIHLVHEPLIADERIEVFETEGDDVVIQQGERLKVSPLKKGERPISSYVKDGTTQNQKGTKFVWDVMNEMFPLKDTPWSDKDKMRHAFKTHANTHPEKWNGNRNFPLWWILKDSYCRYGNFDHGYKIINSSKHIRGDRTDRDLKHKEASIKRTLRERWDCGDVTRRFVADETKEIYHGDMSTLCEDDFDSIPTEGLLFLHSACGTGKTKLAKRIYSKIEPARSLSICFSKAVLLGMAENFGQTYYLDAGDDIEQDIKHFDGKKNKKLNPKQQKEKYCPKEPHLAITVQSLQYILKKDGSFEPYDIIFIDEVEHVLEALHLLPDLAGNVDRYTRHSKQLRILLEICRTARLVIVADDKASDMLTGWFIDSILNWGNKEKFLLKNTWDWLKEMNISIADSEAALFVDVCHAIKQGKNVAIQTSFANKDERPLHDKWRRALAEACDIELGKIKSFTAKDFDDAEEERARSLSNPTLRRTPNLVIPKMIDDGVRIFLCSSWNQIGWSYEGEGIHKTYGIHEALYTHAHDIKQALRRWRLTSDHCVYVTRRQQKSERDVEKILSEYILEAG